VARVRFVQLDRKAQPLFPRHDQRTMARLCAWIFALLIAAAVAAAALWSSADQVAPDPRPPERTNGEAIPVATADAPSETAQGRQIAADADAVPPELAHPFAFDLEVLLLDRDGLPVPNQSVCLGPDHCSLAALPQLTGADGIARARWQGKASAMDIVLTGENLPAWRRLVALAGRTQRIVLEGRSGGPTARFSPQWSTGLHPFARFADEFAVGSNSWVGVIDDFDADAPFLGHRENARAGQEPPAGALEGTVVDGSGEPVAYAAVCCGDAPGVPLLRTRTDVHGCFRFAKVPPGCYEVRAGGRDAGLARARIEVAAGRTAIWDAHLAIASAIRGRAFDAEGRPLAGWTVEVEGIATPWFDACTVRDDGTFLLPNQPPGPHTVLLCRRDDNVPLPVAAVSPVQPDGTEVVLRFDTAAAAGTLRIEPVLPEPADHRSILVRVWQEATGRGVVMHLVGDGPHFRLGDLPAGWYRVEVAAWRYGWRDAGRHWVDGRSVVDLGKLLLCPPGQLRVRRPPDHAMGENAVAQQICARRGDCDVRIEGATPGVGTELTLPAGDYWLLWRDAGGVRRVRAFTMHSGAETLVDEAAGDAPR
jgi:hypothetical protein